MGQRNGIIASESGLMPLPGPDRSPPLVMEVGGKKLEGNWLVREEGANGQPYLLVLDRDIMKCNASL